MKLNTVEKESSILAVRSNDDDKKTPYTHNNRKISMSSRKVTSQTPGYTKTD